MMAMPRRRSDLIDRLPPVRGELSADVPLHRFAWFRVGGPAEVLFEPADAEDLAELLSALPPDVPVTALGVASNLLIRDGGIPGVVVRLGRALAGIEARGTEVVAGVGATDIEVARACRDAGIAGLEFLSGVPGTIGGALRMNAGAYGREMAEVVVSATALDRGGNRHHLTPATLGYRYRHCSVDPEWVFVSAVLRGEPGDPRAIAARMADVTRAREESQPMRTRTGGSTFKNPDGHKAWELIAAAGCRGLTRGGAQVSEKHCNFLINAGGASAADLEGLGEEVRRRVREHSGIELEWEIQRVGVLAPGAGG